MVSGMQQSPGANRSTFRAPYKPNPNTSQSQWNDMAPGFREAFEKSQRNKSIVKVQSPQPGSVDMSAYQLSTGQQHPARRRYYVSSSPSVSSGSSRGVDISSYRPGQSQPKAPAEGDSYGRWIDTDDQTRLADWRDTDGGKVDDRWQAGPGQPSMQVHSGNSRTDDGYVFLDGQAAKSTQPSAATKAVRAPRPAVLPRLPEIRKPTLQVTRAPSVFGVPPQLPQAGFTAQYTDLQGNASEQPGYAQRDAFIDLINQSLLPYQAGEMSGPPQYDISSMLGQAEKMSYGGYQNPFDLRGNGFGQNPLAGLFG